MKTGASRWLVSFLAVQFAHGIALGGITFTTVHCFDGTNGAVPEASLIQASDGSLYGTTIGGGTNDVINGGNGTVFRISTNGTFTSLISLLRATGSNPQSGVLEATPGTLYGVADFGGNQGSGVFYRMTLDGGFTQLYSFTEATGVYPHGVTVGPDGAFYGTGYWGGDDTNIYGTVFRLTLDGAASTVASFHGTNGINPQARVLWGMDGNCYGTTTAGGLYGLGTLFKITPGGTLTTVVSFNGTNGATPMSALIQDGEGNIYGTTYSGGIDFDGLSYSGNGTIFKLAAGGKFATLHQFAGYPTEGTRPSFGGLILARDGYFYGTTEAGGTDGSGSIFRMGQDGTTTLLYSFSRPDYTTGTNADGWQPSAGLVQTSDGNFYGATMNGGNYGVGVIFRLTTFPDPPVLQCASTVPGQLLLRWDSILGKSYELQSTDSLTLTNWQSVGVVVATNTTATATGIIGPNQSRFYRVLSLP